VTDQEELLARLVSLVLVVDVVLFVAYAWGLLG
jgi:hypothetical protein